MLCRSAVKADEAACGGSRRGAPRCLATAAAAVSRAPRRRSPPSRRPSRSPHGTCKVGGAGAGGGGDYVQHQGGGCPHHAGHHDRLADPARYECSGTGARGARVMCSKADVSLNTREQWDPQGAAATQAMRPSRSTRGSCTGGGGGLGRIRRGDKSSHHHLRTTLRKPRARGASVAETGGSAWG